MTERPASLHVLHTARIVEEKLESALGQHGLSLAKYGVLAVLMQHDDSLSLSDLARHLSCMKSNVTQLIDRLEADGWVERRHQSDDRRSIRATLTATGRQACEKGRTALDEADAALLQVFNAAEVQGLQDLLSRFH